MTDEIRIRVMIPFCEEENVLCCFGALPKQKLALRENYMQALMKEIVTSAGDHEGQTVRSIHLTGGVISSVEGRSLDALLTLLESCYRITPETELVLDAMPGEVNIPTVRGCEKHNAAAINLMVFSDDARVRIPAGLSPETEGVDQTNYVMYSVGWQHRCITLSPGMPYNTDITWKKTLGKLSAWKPEWVYLLDAPQGDPEVTETQRTSAEEYLRALGYEKLGRVFSRNGRTLRCFEPETEAVEELGFGLGAYSVIEGIRCRNTQSLTRYILYADRPDQLLTLC